MEDGKRRVSGPLIKSQIVNKRRQAYDWSILERNGDYVEIQLYPLGWQPQHSIKPAFAYARKTQGLPFRLVLTIFKKKSDRWLRVERKDDAF